MNSLQLRGRCRRACRRARCSSWQGQATGLHRHRGSADGNLDAVSAAARATAIDTARIALAQSLDLFGVPSISSKRRSIACCSSADNPMMAGPSLSLTFATA